MRNLIRLLPLLLALHPATVSAEAIDDVVLEGSDGARVTNRNTSSRVYATLRVQSAPANYYLFDANLQPINYSTPRDFGVLLLPGETKPAGVSVILTYDGIGNPQQTQKITLKYTKVGAYYPKPDVFFPDNDRPEHFLRFMKVGLPANFAAVACTIPVPPSGTPEYVYLLNLHPTKIIAVSYKNSSPGMHQDVTAYVNPCTTAPVVCAHMWANISNLTIRFAN